MTVVVPGTSANLGPGFDCLGLAVDAANTFTFRLDPTSSLDEGGLPGRAYAAACRELGLQGLGVRATGGGTVPRARGLGSSSTCVVAGVLAAAALHGHSLSTDEAVRLATSIEGHPDNVAPAILGGVVASVVTGDGRVHAVPVPLARPLPLLALVPDRQLSTAAARAALPASISHADAVHSASRAAVLVAALATGRHDVLAEAFADRLHQPHRAHLIPGVAGIIDAALTAGAAGAYVSGAGPTIMVVDPAVATADALRSHLAAHPWGWQLVPLAVASQGARVLPNGAG